MAQVDVAAYRDLRAALVVGPVRRRLAAEEGRPVGRDQTPLCGKGTTTCAGQRGRTVVTPSFCTRATLSAFKRPICLANPRQVSLVVEGGAAQRTVKQRPLRR